MHSSAKSIYLGLCACSAITAALLTPTYAIGGMVDMTVPLTTNQMRVCLSKEAAINSRNQQMLALSDSIEAKFDDIANKVNAYDTSKLLPADKNAYDIETLKGTIPVRRTALNSEKNFYFAQTDIFKCSNHDPIRRIESIDMRAQAISEGLAAYRESIEIVITAIQQRTRPGNVLPTKLSQ